MHTITRTCTYAPSARTGMAVALDTPHPATAHQLEDVLAYISAVATTADLHAWVTDPWTSPQTRLARRWVTGRITDPTRTCVCQMTTAERQLLDQVLLHSYGARWLTAGTPAA